MISHQFKLTEFVTISGFLVLGLSIAICGCFLLDLLVPKEIFAQVEQIPRSPAQLLQDRIATALQSRVIPYVERELAAVPPGTPNRDRLEAHLTGLKAKAANPAKPLSPKYRAEFGVEGASRIRMIKNGDDRVYLLYDGYGKAVSMAVVTGND